MNRLRSVTHGEVFVLIASHRLLRNCSLDDLAGRAIDEVEAEMCGALTEAAEDVRPVLRVVRVGAGIGSRRGRLSRCDRRGSRACARSR